MIFKRKTNDREFNRIAKPKRKKDFSKQRDSGLNTVLVNIAKKNGVLVGIDLDEIRFSEKKEKAKIIARVMQNVNLCKKKRVQMKFISRKGLRNEFILKSLGMNLGMPTWMTKNI